jgi:hypothetical protein
MIDPTCPGASWFLIVTPVALLIVFALPLLIAPLAWARVFRWNVAGRDDLTEYLGRCLGALAIAIVYACLRAAPQPRAHLELFEMLIVAGSLLTLVHVWGAITRRQPWTETVEIALYGGLTAAFVWLRTTLVA